MLISTVEYLTVVKVKQIISTCINMNNLKIKVEWTTKTFKNTKWTHVCKIWSNTVEGRFKMELNGPYVLAVFICIGLFPGRIFFFFLSINTWLKIKFLDLGYGRVGNRERNYQWCTYLISKIFTLISLNK